MGDTDREKAGQGWIDIHAHILPGVDDGSSDWQESEKMLSVACAQGIRHIIATPHFSRRQDIEQLKNLQRELQKKADMMEKSVVISLGQEILYFEELIQYLEQGRALTLAGSRYVLVEFLPGDGFGRLYRAVRSLVQASYLPVIAHAERYCCLGRRGRAGELADCGAYLQVNAGSLKGGMLDKQAAWCRKEILNGTIHYIATDMHGAVRRPPDIEGAAAWLAKQSRHMKQGEDWLTGQLFRENQEFILRDAVL